MESEFYKKASQAKGSYGDRRVTQGDILLVYDAGLFSTGKRGFFLTDDAIYYKSKYGFKNYPGVKGWLCFETLTLIPFEKRLINLSMLSSEEIFPNTCETVLKLLDSLIDGGEPMPILILLIF